MEAPMKPAKELRSSFPILGHQRAELLVLQGIARRGAQALAIERLGEKIEGPEPHRLHRHIHRAVSGDHHHGAGQLPLRDLLQDVHAGHVGQFQVEQHHGGGLASNCAKACWPQSASCTS
jgi:hypothetical protein